MAVVFVSYRREDTRDTAAHLGDLLDRRLMPGSTFVDLADLQPGDEFPVALARAIDQARVVVVLMGARWGSVLVERANGAGRDHVLYELDRAVARHRTGACQIIPVLVGNAALPAADDLPPAARDALAAVQSLTHFHLRAHEPHEYDALAQRIATLVPEHAALPAIPHAAPRIRNRSAREINRECARHFHDPLGVVGRIASQFSNAIRLGRPARTVLCGASGTGKTQLALKTAQQLDAQHAGIWWFGAGTQRDLKVEVEACCAQLRIGIAPGADPFDTLGRWLDDQALPWLLVVEDATRAEREALGRLMPESPQHHVLITSAVRDWPGMELLLLEGWPEDGAAAYLQLVAGLARVDALAVSTALSGLPLALDHAAQSMLQRGYTAQDYLRLLADAPSARGLIAQRFADDAGRMRSIADTVHIACAALSPAALSLLRLCALCAPDWLPERCLIDAANMLPPALAAAAASPAAWWRVRQELVLAGLVRCCDDWLLDAEDDVPAGDVDTLLSVHRLTQRAVQILAADADADVAVEGGADVARCADIIDSSCRSELLQVPVHWPRARLFARHAHFLGLQSDSVPALQLCQRAGDIFAAAGDPYAAHASRLRCVQLAERLAEHAADERLVAAQLAYRAAIEAYFSYYHAHHDEFWLAYETQYGSCATELPGAEQAEVYVQLLGLMRRLTLDLARELGANDAHVADAERLSFTMQLGYLQAAMVNRRYPWGDPRHLRAVTVEQIMQTVIRVLLHGALPSPG